MSFLSTFIRSFYAKALFAIALGVLGIMAGFYIGYSYIATPSESASISGPVKSADRSLLFVAGNLFPLEDYTLADGTPGNFEQLLAKKPTVVLFTHLGCDVCFDLIKFWRKEVRPRLRPDVQEVICLPTIDNPVSPTIAGMFEGFSVCFIDKNLWLQKYGMDFTPIIIGVDGSGFVVHEQFGFEGYIENPIVSRFCTSR